MGVAINDSQCHGVDEIDVARHQFAKRGLGASSRVFLKQLCVIPHRLLSIRTRRKGKSDRKSALTRMAAWWGKRRRDRTCARSLVRVVQRINYSSMRTR